MQCLLCAFLTELPTVLAKAHSQQLEPSLWVFAKLSHPEHPPKPSLVLDTEDVSLVFPPSLTTAYVPRSLLLAVSGPFHLLSSRPITAIGSC